MPKNPTNLSIGKESSPENSENKNQRNASLNDKTIGNRNTNGHAQNGTLDRWWKAFNDPVLNTLVERTLTHNLDIAQAATRVDAALTRIGTARSGWFPSISGTGRIGRQSSVFNFPTTDAQGNKTSIAQTFVQDFYQLSLGASYEIDLFGKTFYAKKAADYGAIAAREQQRAAYLRIAATVADTYFLIVQQRVLLSKLQVISSSRSKQRDLIKKRYEAGLVGASDYYQSSQLAEAAKSTLSAVELVLREAENALLLLMGENGADRRPLERIANSLPNDLPSLPETVDGMTLLARPDIAAAYAILKATDMEVGRAFANFFPSLAVSGSYGYRFRPNGLLWDIFGNLTAPLFQGGRIKALHKEKQAQLREQILSFRQILNKAFLDIDLAGNQNLIRTKQLEHLEAQYDSAKKANMLTKAQYTEGIGSYLAVLTAEQSEVNALTSLLDGKRALISARISMARALGGNWTHSYIDAADPDIAFDTQSENNASAINHPLKKDIVQDSLEGL